MSEISMISLRDKHGRLRIYESRKDRPIRVTVKKETVSGEPFQDEVGFWTLEVPRLRVYRYAPFWIAIAYLLVTLGAAASIAALLVKGQVQGGETEAQAQLAMGAWLISAGWVFWFQWSAQRRMFGSWLSIFLTIAVVFKSAVVLFLVWNALPDQWSIMVVEGVGCLIGLVAAVMTFYVKAGLIYEYKFDGKEDGYC